MGRMVRKHFYIRPEQEKLLKQQAQELGVTEAELIRRAIDQFSKAPVAFLPDRQRTWEAAKEFMDQRGRIQVAQTGRGWTREDLYEERLEQHFR